MAVASEDDPRAALERDVLEGLSRAQKAIPSRWLYDAAGSALFDQITDLPEYYPTRTELGILADHAGGMAAAIGPDALLVEYGAGSLVKVRYLLDALETPSGFVPVDISRTHLEEAAGRLRADYPDLPVYPVVGDFMSGALGNEMPDVPGRRVGFFPGSTIGNLLDDQILKFLSACRRDLGGDGGLLIGIDRPKSPDVLVPAYDDAAGVTAAFNLNLLTRLNRELGADFDLDAFRHRAVWNAPESRIEMHLVSVRRQAVRMAGRSFDLAEGETIHTENSRKIAMDVFAGLAEQAGWRIETRWTDARGYFAMMYLV